MAKVVLKLITRETVEHIAHIIGPQGAAAQAIKEADSGKYKNPVFVQAPGRLLVMSAATAQKDFGLAVDCSQACLDNAKEVKP